MGRTYWLGTILARLSRCSSSGGPTRLEETWLWYCIHLSAVHICYGGFTLLACFYFSVISNDRGFKFPCSVWIRHVGGYSKSISRSLWPLEYSEISLLTAQGFQSVGSALSRVIAESFLLPDEHNIAQVIYVQWVYLSVALFVILLAACFHYVPVPRVGQEDLHRLAEMCSANNPKYSDVVWSSWHLVWGCGLNSIFRCWTPRMKQIPQILSSRFCQSK